MQDWLLYSCLFRSRCLATDLHATILSFRMEGKITKCFIEHFRIFDLMKNQYMIFTVTKLEWNISKNIILFVKVGTFHSTCTTYRVLATPYLSPEQKTVRSEMRRSRKHNFMLHDHKYQVSFITPPLYCLNSCCEVLHRKLIVAQLVTKFRASYGIQRFISVPTKVFILREMSKVYTFISSALRFTFTLFSELNHFPSVAYSIEVFKNKIVSIFCPSLACYRSSLVWSPSKCLVKGTNYEAPLHSPVPASKYSSQCPISCM
jgi:hypothetical protein